MALHLLRPRLDADMVMMLPWYYWVKTAVLAKKLYGRPYIVWLDTYTYERQPTLWGRIYHELRYGILLRNADLVIAESPECHQIAIERMPNVRVVHIPMPLGLDRFKAAEAKWAADGDQPRREPVILFVGRISPEKGPHILVEAFSQIAKDFPEWKLKMVGPLPREIPEWIRKAVGIGNQDYLKLILDKIKAAGLQDRFEYIPGLYGEALYRAYAESSVYVLPSFWEGVPTTVLEAMYFGGAIIASKVGIVPYQLDYGQVGMIVEPGQGDALATAMKRMMENEPERNLYVQQAHTRMVEKFSWEANINTLREEILRLIPGSSYTANPKSFQHL
jgi:glycosyltransferase involved in cell wall biosynthesis